MIKTYQEIKIFHRNKIETIEVKRKQQLKPV
jgi:hypothetical protein